MTIDSRDKKLTYCSMDAIFKAMADPARRQMLDALRQRDGQTLSELGARFEMTRFGVMKHLSVLEEAGLVTTVKRGRFKYHYLNAVPLQQVMDRWMAPMARPAARSLIDLKAALEARTSSVTHTVFIAAPVGRVWTALTDATELSRYNYMADDVTRSGATYTFSRAGSPLLRMTTTSATEPVQLTMTFDPAWADLPTSTVTNALTSEGANTKLTLTHTDLPQASNATSEGWLRTLAGLKTLLETGSAPKFRAALSPAAPDRNPPQETPK